MFFAHHSGNRSTHSSGMPRLYLTPCLPGLEPWAPPVVCRRARVVRRLPPALRRRLVTPSLFPDGEPELGPPHLLDDEPKYGYVGPIPGFENPRQRLRKAPGNRFKFTRQVKGGAWQARVWLGVNAGESLNLGLFTAGDDPAGAEWFAGRASKEFLKHFRPGVTLRQTLDHLKAKGFIPKDVLPPRVKLVPDGYVGHVKKCGQWLETTASKCPWIAYTAICDLLATTFPPQPRVTDVREQERTARDRWRVTIEQRRYSGGTLFEARELLAA